VVTAIDPAVTAATDAYFEATRRIVVQAGDVSARYGLFMRRPVVACLEPAVRYLAAHGGPGLAILHRAPEGSTVAAETPLLIYEGSLARLVELETGLLQRTGVPCVAAANAAAIVAALPEVPFIAMHARHCAGDDMVRWCEYAAAVGSLAARRTIPTARGFVGGSTTIGAAFVADLLPDLPWRRMGTMPHVLIGYAQGSALAATRLFLAHTDIVGVTVLVDFQGREVSDACEVAIAWAAGELPGTEGKRLSFRLDTHGGRFIEGLDSDGGRRRLAARLGLAPDELVPVLRTRLGLGPAEDDRLAMALFGPGMSAAAVLHFRQALDAAGQPEAGIVASSGFDVFKCRAFAAVGMGGVIAGVGTGSFLPAGLAETYATADAFMIDGVFRVKEGRQTLFQDWAR
jgi:nicotinate phosphoribosyltransferase